MKNTFHAENLVNHMFQQFILKEKEIETASKLRLIRSNLFAFFTQKNYLKRIVFFNY